MEKSISKMENISQKTPVVKVFTAIFTVIALLITVLAALLGSLNGIQAGGIFKNSVGNISDKYHLELTPSSFVFGTIWPIIFLWTIIGGIYLVVSLFLNPKNSPVKMNPALTPLAYFILVSVAYASANAWYFAFDNESLGWSFVLLLLTVVSTYSAIGITLKRVCDNAPELVKTSKVTLWLVRIMVQNGLCLLATWVTIATMLGLTMILVYVDSPGLAVAKLSGLVSMETGSSISLGILLGFTILWFVLENFVWEKYLRYMFTIYPVFILAFSGVIVKLQGSGSRQNLILASVNCAISIILFLTRIGLSIYRCYRHTPCKVSTHENEKFPIEE